MSKLTVKKVPSPKDRELPIFEELENFADQIRVRAYSLFANRGFSEGHELDDWLAAQREIGWPEAELVEKDDQFLAKVALAGFESEDITVTATPNEVIVKASRKTEREDDETDEDARVRWSEFHFNDVYRQIAFPSDVDVGNITANFSKGMLEITAPKAKGEKSSSETIAVSSSE